MGSNPFRSGLKERIGQAIRTKSINAAANALFGPTVDKYSDYFEGLKEDLKQADIDVLYRTYVSKIFFYTAMVFVLGFFSGLTYTLATGQSLLMILRTTLGLPLALSIVTAGGMYIYPSQVAKRRDRNIDENLPFALNHLGAIATSGIPPSSMFQLLHGFEEYGSVSEDAGEISRRVNVFGEGLTTAVREVAETTPNDDWSEFLFGLVSTVEKGGDLESFMQEQAEEALFEYKMSREKEIERISTYASFYTAILIAAPVFLVVILSVMNLLGGNIMGFAIRDLMFLGVHILIPVINGLFIIFLLIKVD